MSNSIPHESAHKHVTGQAVYVDDMPVNDQLLYGRVVYSNHAHAKIKSIDTSKALELEGVHSVLSHKDIPGQNNLGPVEHDETCLAKNEVIFIGQAICLIAAESDEICRKAEKLINIEYGPLKPILSIKEAMAAGNQMGTDRKIERGDVQKGLDESAHKLTGSLETGAQEHWYLETHAAVCIPGEDNEMQVYSSTQHPSETQAIVSKVLGINRNDVTVEVRRMGGAFGGKETQANHYAAWSALLANAVHRPVKIRLSRDDDQIMTGKRHPFLINYKAGFDNDGKLLALKVEQNSDGGAATDLSFPILERAMFHADNAYYIPNMSVIGRVWRTNLPPNTAFRGFGGPQGMAAMEEIIDRIARFLGKDALEIRRLNFYGEYERNTTHYEQEVENNRLQIIYNQLVESSEYHKRRQEVNAFNQKNEFYKKGLALTPVKFGISFTTSLLNQAGALVNIYQDGTVLVNHGGTEMGQGLHTKIQQIAAFELGLPVEQIKITPTDTSKVPNTSATAASSGTDLNGMAVKNAIDKLKERISLIIALYFNENKEQAACIPGHIMFRDGMIFDATNSVDSKLTFKEAVEVCYVNRISLSATGYYRTPDVHFDREKGRGKPFHYFAFGMAASEVLVDTLTGHVELLRTDILHDAGDSINPAIDRGQIEGGFIQGVGWCTTEVVKWDNKGHLLNHSPDTYKIPTMADIPKEFNVELLQKAPNPNTIRQSKAVGEPPFMLALSVWLAIKDAVSAVADNKFEPPFALPASDEVILRAVEYLRNKNGSA